MSRWFLLLTLIGFSASVAMADGIDPKVIIGGGGHSTPIVGNTFTFTVDDSGGGVFDFIAPTLSQGEDIFTLALTFVAPTTDLSLYSCNTGGLFPTCGFTLNGDGTVTALFSGGHEDEAEWLDDLAEGANSLLGTQFDANDINGGIEEGQEFTIDLGANGWVAGTNVTGVLNPVPEPGTLGLLLAGLGLLGIGRKRLGV